MRYTGGESRQNAFRGRAAVVSLVTLGAVIVALVLMHGMSGSRLLMAHSATAPAVTAGPFSANPIERGESRDHLVDADAEAAAAFPDTLVPSDQAATDSMETGGAPWLGVAVLMMFLLISLALVLGLSSSRREFPIRSPALVSGGARPFIRAVPVRLATSIDRR